MKRGAKVGLAFVGGALVLAAMSRGSKGIGPIVAQPWAGPQGGGQSDAVPSPPTQGNGFRVGPQADPAAPNDPNRGRTFAVMEQSRQSATTALGTLRLFDLPMDAAGRIELRAWANRAGAPNVCTKWRGSVNVNGGRLVLPSTLYPEYCVPPVQGVGGQPHVTWNPPGPCTMDMPRLSWEQQGPTVTLLWRTHVKSGNIWSDQDCSEDLQFYVDAFWRWIPV
jgi:hypothetical protein